MNSTTLENFYKTRETCLFQNVSLQFASLKEYYTEGVISCPPGVEIFRLRSACEYFLIPFTPTTIKCHNLGKTKRLQNIRFKHGSKISSSFVSF